MSRLIRIFTVCLVNVFLYSNYLNMKQTRSLSEFTSCPKLPDFTLVRLASKCLLYICLTYEMHVKGHCVTPLTRPIQVTPNPGILANNADPDEMPHNVSSGSAMFAMIKTIFRD